MPDVTIIQEADWTLSTLGHSLLLTPQIVQANWSSSFCLRYSEGPSQNKNVHLWMHFFLILNSLILTGSVINPFQGALDDHPLHPCLARPLHPHSLSVPTQHLLKNFVRKGCNI